MATSQSEEQPNNLSCEYEENRRSSALEAIDASIQALVLDKRAANQKAKLAQLLVEVARKISDDS